MPADGGTFGTSGSATFGAFARDFQAKNLTIANDFDEGTNTSNVQAVALMTQADKLIFENVRFLGNQDTLYVKTGNADQVARAYFKGCYVEGDVDFIFGRATFVLDACEIKYLTARRGSSGGQILSPSTDVRNPYGILVINSMFTAETGTPAGLIGLGRAWDEGGTSGATMYPAAGAATLPERAGADSRLGAGRAHPRRRSLAGGGHHRAAVQLDRQRRRSSPTGCGSSRTPARAQRRPERFLQSRASGYGAML